MKDLFKSAEDEYFVLRGKLETGRITRQEFQVAVSKLTASDEQGKFYVMDPDTGEWKESAAPPPVEERAAKGQAGAGYMNKPTNLPEQKRQGINKIAAAGLISLFVVCALLIGILSFSSLNRNGAVVVATSVPPKVIAAKDFAASNALLADKIAALNQAQLKFIRDMRASSSLGRVPGLAFPLSQKGSSLTDEDLKDMAGKAMDVAILSDQLGELSGRQDKGSANAAQSAEAYLAIARNAYSLVIDAQNVRQALLNNLMPGAQAIEIIAQYGVQLWNNSVTDGSSKGNPFAVLTKNAEPVQSLNPNAASQVQSQVNAVNSPAWIAQSATRSTRTLNVPAAQAPVSNPFDPQLKVSLITSAGQSDGKKAQQVATSNLQRLGATANSTDPSKPSQLQVPTSPVAVSGANQINAGNIPTFKSGKATVISKNNSSDENPFIQALSLNGEQPPTDQGRTTVQDAPPLVSMTITNLVIENINKRPKDAFNTFEADVKYSFTVNWSTNLVSPQFEMDCVSGNHYDIAAAGGSQLVSAKGLLILYPGTEDAYCYASRGGNTWGSASVHFLVGDADGATKRALQVETDSASLDATLTVEARGTTSAQQTQAAATAQSNATSNAVATEVSGTRAAEFKITAAAAETVRLRPPPPSTTPLPTPTFVPRVVDTLSHPGDIFSVVTRVALQRGRLYRFTFSGRINVINPPRSLSAGQLPDRVNGIAVPASGVMVIQGTGGVAVITCGHEVPDPKNPGAYGIVVEDLGPS